VNLNVNLKSSARMPALVGLLVLLARIAAVLPFAPVVAGDSSRYRDPMNPVSVFEVWTGRGPGVLLQTLFLLPGVWGLIGQIVVSAALWTAAALLLYAVAHRYKWIVFGLMMLATLNPWASIWDSWYLTEDVTIAGCVAAAVGGAVFAVGSRPRVPSLSVAIAGSAAAILARPYSAVLVLPLLALALLLPPVWRRGMSRRVLLTGGLVVAAVSLFAVWQVVEFEYIANGGQIVQVRAAERLGLRGSDPGYLAVAKAHGMPPCPSLETALTNSATTTQRLTLARNSTCPGYQAWLRSGGLSWESELLNTPRATIAAFVHPAYWAAGSVHQYVPYDPRGQWLMAHASPLITPLSRAINILTYLAGAASIVVALVVAARSRRRAQVIFTVLALGWIAVFVFIAWADTGIENWRHVLPGLYVIGPMCWALTAATSSSSGDSSQSMYEPENRIVSPVASVAGDL